MFSLLIQQVEHKGLLQPRARGPDFLTSQVCSSVSQLKANLRGSWHWVPVAGASLVWSNPVGTSQCWQESPHLACSLMDYIFVFLPYFIKEQKDFGCNFVLVSDTHYSLAINPFFHAAAALKQGRRLVCRSIVTPMFTS